MEQRAVFVASPRAKPFLKWAGGKSQLIEQMSQFFPLELGRGEIKRYIEPFLGSGAVFFHITQSHRVGQSFLFDVNEEIVLAYNTIKRDVSGVIQLLTELQDEYQSLHPDEQQTLFYQVRDKFNEQRIGITFGRYQAEWVERTAYLIFLNRTCFNGLFRVNSKGDFNVPFGRYKNPLICSRENLEAVAVHLQATEIKQGDFSDCKPLVTPKTFVYFDPPYVPISPTSSFTSYSKHEFGRGEHERLAKFFRSLDKTGAKLMLSNSDPKNENPLDNSLEELYRGFFIQRVMANRMINADATKRGKITELLVTNYPKQF